MKGSNKILGGYNPIECTKDRFSFKNSYTRIENFILSCVKNKTYATVYIIVKFMNHHLVLVTCLHYMEVIVITEVTANNQTMKSRLENL